MPVRPSGKCIATSASQRANFQSFCSEQEYPEYAEAVARVGSGSSSQIIDTKRFQLGPPEGGLQASEEEWQEAVDNAATQLMHQEARLRNVELLKRYGGELPWSSAEALSR